jgi:hypothetical protein
MSKNMTLWTGLAATVVAATTMGFSAESKADYATTILADNPVAYYHLGESSGSALDSSGGAHDAALDGGTVVRDSPSIVPTTNDGSATFGGANNGRFVAPGFDKIDTGYSVEYWIRVDTMPTAGSCCAPLVGDGEGSGTFFLMNYLLGSGQGTTGDIRPHYSFANSPVSLNSNTALQTGNIYHVVTTWDSTSAVNNGKIYINGVLDKQGSVTDNIANDALKLFLGRDDREGYNSALFTLDEVALYDHALTGSQVAAHFAAGIPEPATLGLLSLGALALVRRRHA